MLVDELRRAIKTSGLSLYRLALDTGVDHSVLSRFMGGKRDIGLATAGKLTKYLGLKLTQN